MTSPLLLATPNTPRNADADSALLLLRAVLESARGDPELDEDANETEDETDETPP
jgi:hypothetical protein